MRLLDRYLLRELAVALGFCLSGFLLFWVAFDLFDRLDDFRRAGLGFSQVVYYYWFRVPEMLFTIMPVALLLGLLYALANHARHHELIAIMAAGTSLWRLSVPYFGMGLLFSVVLYALNEGPMGSGNEAAERLLRQASGSTADRLWQPNLHFRNERDDRTWSCGAFHLLTGELRGPHVDYGVGDGVRRQLYAESARWEDQQWVFREARLYEYHLQTDPLPTPVLVTNLLVVPELTETPALIRSEIKISNLNRVRAARKVELTIAEILDYRRLHPVLPPRDRALLDTQLHSRFASPWTCLVVVLIALPFGAPSGRRNVFVGVASSIVICFAYVILSKVTLALGTGGHLPPWASAWLPNLAFGGIGLWLTSRVR